MQLEAKIQIKNIPDDLTLYDTEKLFSDELKDTKDAIMSSHYQTLGKIQSTLQSTLEHKVKNYFEEDIFDAIDNNEDIPLIDADKLEIDATIRETGISSKSSHIISIIWYPDFVKDLNTPKDQMIDQCIYCHKKTIPEKLFSVYDLRVVCLTCLPFALKEVTVEKAHGILK